MNIPHVVITDGDPDANGELDGVQRGRRLLGPIGRKAIDAALAIDDLDEAVAVLQARHVFVGSTTLELDLLPAARDAMLTAYGELEVSTSKRSHFTADLDAFINDGTRDTAILRRLNTIGKGRFAQRLAGHVASFEPPEFITAALDRCRTQVQP